MNANDLANLIKQISGDYDSNYTDERETKERLITALIDKYHNSTELTEQLKSVNSKLDELIELIKKGNK